MSLLVKRKLRSRKTQREKKLEDQICRDSETVWGRVWILSAEDVAPWQEVECAASVSKGCHKHHHWICQGQCISLYLCLQACSVFGHHLPSSKFPSKIFLCFIIIPIILHFLPFSFCPEVDFLVAGQRPFAVCELHQKNVFLSLFNWKWSTNQGTMRISSKILIPSARNSKGKVQSLCACSRSMLSPGWVKKWSYGMPVPTL